MPLLQSRAEHVRLESVGVNQIGLESRDRAPEARLVPGKHRRGFAEPETQRHLRAGAPSLVDRTPLAQTGQRGRHTNSRARRPDVLQLTSERPIAGDYDLEPPLGPNTPECGNHSEQGDLRSSQLIRHAEAADSHVRKVFGRPGARCRTTLVERRQKVAPDSVRPQTACGPIA